MFFPFLRDIELKQRLVIIIDEFTYLHSSNPAFDSILQNAIDRVLKQKNIFLILCGSEVSTIEDIIDFQNRVMYVKVPHENSNWAYLWSKKIDYFEYQVNQFGIKYPTIRKSFNYFVGLAENGITAYNDFHDDYIECSIVHKRLLLTSKLYDLYDPFNLIYDVKSRDFCEYIKNCFFNNQDALLIFKNNIGLFNFTSQELLLFYIRLFYPSFYFDVYEKIVEEGEVESKLDVIIGNVGKYEIFLKEITSFLEQYITLPNIEWIKKVVKLN